MRKYSIEIYKQKKGILKSTKISEDLQNRGNSLRGKNVSKDNNNCRSSTQERFNMNKNADKIRSIYIDTNITNQSNQLEGTLRDLRKEDKIKVGNLMKKLAQEKEEKEQLQKIMNQISSIISRETKYALKYSNTKRQTSIIYKQSQTVQGFLSFGKSTLNLEIMLNCFFFKRQQQSNETLKQQRQYCELEQYKHDQSIPQVSNNQNGQYKSQLQDRIKQTSTLLNSQTYRTDKEFKQKDSLLNACSKYFSNNRDEDFMNTSGYKQSTKKNITEYVQSRKPQRIMIEKKKGESEEIMNNWKQNSKEGDKHVKQPSSNEESFCKCKLLPPFKEVKQLKSKMESLVSSFKQINENLCSSYVQLHTYFNNNNNNSTPSQQSPAPSKVLYGEVKSISTHQISEQDHLTNQDFQSIWGEEGGGENEITQTMRNLEQRKLNPQPKYYDKENTQINTHNICNNDQPTQSEKQNWKNHMKQPLNDNLYPTFEPDSLDDNDNAKSLNNNNERRRSYDRVFNQQNKKNKGKAEDILQNMEPSEMRRLLKIMKHQLRSNSSSLINQDSDQIDSNLFDLSNTQYQQRIQTLKNSDQSRPSSTSHSLSQSNEIIRSTINPQQTELLTCGNRQRSPQLNKNETQSMRNRLSKQNRIHRKQESIYEIDSPQEILLKIKLTNSFNRKNEKIVEEQEENQEQCSQDLDHLSEKIQQLSEEQIQQIIAYLHQNQKKKLKISSLSLMESTEEKYKQFKNSQEDTSEEHLNKSPKSIRNLINSESRNQRDGRHLRQNLEEIKRSPDQQPHFQNQMTSELYPSSQYLPHKPIFSQNFKQLCRDSTRIQKQLIEGRDYKMISHQDSSSLDNQSYSSGTGSDQINRSKYDEEE